MLRSTPIRLLRAALVGCLLALAACGPIQSAQAIREGQKSLETARLAEAEQLAPYHFHRALAYLEMAKRKSGFSEFEVSQEYAKVAKVAADQAVVNARKRQALKLILEQRRLKGAP
ncbi:MAG: hypothetical protein AMXMBFR64_29690 [Myxococcales bacterium]